MTKFIPQYEAKTPEEQGKLEQQFLTLMKYLSLDAREDYKVKVSEKEGVVYLKPIDVLSQIKNGTLSISSRGDNVTSIDRITTKIHQDCLQLSHHKEIIVNGQKFIFVNYSRLSV
ncbi:MAG: hypothetical protein AABX31_00915 [Nanoarchaeota archaeon]